MFSLFQELGPMPGKYMDPLKNYLVPRLRVLLGNYSKTPSDLEDPKCNDSYVSENISNASKIVNYNTMYHKY